MYAARNIAATAATHVWFHLKDRVNCFVKMNFKLSRGAYRALDADARKQRPRDLKLVCLDVLRLSDKPMRSPPGYHKWIESERIVMQMDDISSADVLAVWTPMQTDGCPGLGFYAKKKPHLFVMAMVRTVEGRSTGSSIYPECRSCVPGYMHVDSHIISALVKKKVKARKRKRDPGAAVPSSDHDETHPSGRRPRRKSNDPELVAEKHSIFAG
jgi:hypothetical protein